MDILFFTLEYYFYYSYFSTFRSSSTEGEKIHEYENLLQHNKASLQTKISNQYDTVAELPTHFKPVGEKEFAKRKFARFSIIKTGTQYGRFQS